MAEIHVVLPKHMDDEFRAFCHQHGFKYAEVIKKALHRFLNENEYTGSVTDVNSFLGVIVTSVLITFPWAVIYYL